MSVHLVNQEHLPARLHSDNQNTGRYSLSLPKIVSRINRIAVPAIAILILDNIPTALAATNCAELCKDVEGWAAIVVCWALCAIAQIGS